MTGKGELQVGDPAPPPPTPRAESDLTATWAGDAPVVSICCSTYQHVAFIEDALRGFLGQRTDFPFEVLIRDDASTDGTAEIVADYADRYPNVVRAILEPKNTWRTPARRNLRDLATSPFIALCEGDDYWVDPRKLQVQITTLRQRPEAAVSFHRAVAIQDGRVIDLDRLPRHLQRDIPRAQLRLGPAIRTQTLCFRNVSFTRHRHHDRIVNGDTFLIAQLGTLGDASYERSLGPAVYRVHPGGIYSMQERELRAMRSAESHFWIGDHFVAQDDHDAAVHFLTRSAEQIIKAHPELTEAIAHRLHRRLLPRGPRRLVRRAGRIIAHRAPSAFGAVQRTRDSLRARRLRRRRSKGIRAAAP